jgi:hypothetical protein
LPLRNTIFSTLEKIFHFAILPKSRVAKGKMAKWAKWQNECQH